MISFTDFVTLWEFCRVTESAYSIPATYRSVSRIDCRPGLLLAPVDQDRTGRGCRRTDRTDEHTASEHIRPDTDLARVTLTALLHGQPLSQGHMQVQLTAPPRTRVVATGFPRVEGTALLALDTALTDGTWTAQYLLPIRGTYTFDVGIAPVPGGPVFQPTRLRQTVHISENPTVVRNAGMLIGGLFLLGGITGIIFARSAAAREKLWSRAIVGLLIGLGGALVPCMVLADTGHTSTAVDASQGRQIIQGDQGWELEVQASPIPATVGQLVQFAIWLRKEGAIFPGLTEVHIEAVHREQAHTGVLYIDEVSCWVSRHKIICSPPCKNALLPSLAGAPAPAAPWYGLTLCRVILCSCWLGMWPISRKCIRPCARASGAMAMRSTPVP